MKRHIDLAGEFKTQVISGIVHGNLDQNPAVRQQQWEWMLDGFQQIDRYAGEMGVLFAIEAVNRFETNCFNTCEEIRTFILTHNLKSCRIHLDTFHMNIEEVSIEAAIRLAGENLSYVHCADSNRQYPGSGHLNYPSILTALRRINFKGSWVWRYCQSLIRKLRHANHWKKCAIFSGRFEGIILAWKTG